VIAKKHAYPLRILASVDQFVNAVVGPVVNLSAHGRLRGPWGYIDETISGVVGKYRLSGILRPGAYPIIWALDLALDWLKAGHVERAAELTEGYTLDEMRALSPLFGGRNVS